MQPKMAAEIWAAQHLGYEGILLVEKETDNGRLGTTKTTYKYAVSGGECTRITGDADKHPLCQRLRNKPTKTIPADWAEW